MDGGASANNLLIQLQADLAQTPIQRPKILDTTALGSGLAAGLATGVWKDTNELKKSWQIDKTFQPEMSDARREKMKAKWAKAIERVLLK